jgi:uncharacterized membrane protein YkoI
MRLQRASFATAVLAGCAAASATLAVRVAAAPHRSACAATATTPNLTMEQAVKMVEERFHARVVKAETQRDNGRTVYMLRLLNDAGRVWTVHVDAASGSVE